ncbi:polyadenylate-binding protein 2-like [Oppia nitens]|uniref:polyadenylate-binding protein 2-like n=1 Tax=Oppia nitens TaxID=1686743 RepID=UPI0023D9DE39|nr:polyadenylate-binding protein 2-like [Oppia nitens]
MSSSVELDREDISHANGGDESTGALADDEHNDSDIHSDHMNSTSDATEDPELEAIKARVREMEEEAERLKIMQEVMNDEDKHDADSPNASTSGMSIEEKMEVDGRSVYVGNVDYSATADDLERHFHGCGSVNRVTILCDKYSGHPKGFAYIEFADKDSVETATALDESLFKGRQIRVSAKRTNRPGISSTNRPPRGRGTRRGAYMGRSAPWFGRPSRRPRRGSWFGYSPY